MSRAKKIIIALVAAGALAIGGVFAWILFIRDDAPPALTSADLDEALDGADTTAVGDPAVTSPADTATADTASADAGGSATVTDPTGTWAISTDSVLGYRVSEVLGGVDTEGAGRTNDVAGSLTIEGSSATAAEFIVQMASITSDSDRRDGQFNGRIMSTDEFPTATFVLTEPIDFGTVPSEGETITASATGELTLRGVTNTVTFELEAKLDDGRIGVFGNIPILFSDYEIPDPSNGFAVVKDNGLLEFVLVFDPAT